MFRKSLGLPQREVDFRGGFLGKVVGAAIADFADDFNAGLVARAEPEFPSNDVGIGKVACGEGFVDDGYFWNWRPSMSDMPIKLK